MNIIFRKSIFNKLHFKYSQVKNVDFFLFDQHMQCVIPIKDKQVKFYVNNKFTFGVFIDILKLEMPLSKIELKNENKKIKDTFV